jgi:protein ImuB
MEADYRQEELFVAESGTDLDAAEKALASLRAELGNDAVAGVQLFDSHLPEERFRFKTTAGIQRPRAETGIGPARADADPDSSGGRAAAAGSSGRRLVRRIRTHPLSVPQAAAPGHGEAYGDGPTGSLRGPFVLSGHWWRTESVHRNYYYLHHPDVRTLWIYSNAGRKGRHVQGSVD